MRGARRRREKIDVDKIAVRSVPALAEQRWGSDRTDQGREECLGVGRLEVSRRAERLRGLEGTREGNM